MQTDNQPRGTIRDGSYKFRGLPCNIAPDHELWCVSGRYLGGGGILEWCYNKGDAEHLLGKMKRDRRFSGLRVHAYIEG